MLPPIQLLAILTELINFTSLFQILTDAQTTLLLGRMVRLVLAPKMEVLLD